MTFSVRLAVCESQIAYREGAKTYGKSFSWKNVSLVVKLSASYVDAIQNEDHTHMLLSGFAVWCLSLYGIFRGRELYVVTIQGVSQLLKQSDWAQIQDFKW